ncbi:hypothetical protein J7384_17075 [Endozoicomonas sp. G2_1]|uniref:hypothetical protein n=1 Tax=Endozoicomonas sp. G2_1 TaxID=2821091 RepID=UPI001ADA27B8|nr:hypothetical protein [Endozoicomonas sp. G2_1]MBO9492077.1 hypothetical protein [Endozoicomonas sp. G2_1]
MADYTEFTSLVNNFVPNIPPFVVAKAAQQCSQDFFGRTTELQEQQTLSVTEGKRKYTLRPQTADTFINLVLSVEDDKGREIAFCQHANELVLDPIPRKNEDLTIRLALCPNLESSEIPDDVYFRHSTPLRYGVLAILKAQPNTEWYHPQEAASYRAMYEQEISQSKILQYTTNPYLKMEIDSFN